MEIKLKDKMMSKVSKFEEIMAKVDSKLNEISEFDKAYSEFEKLKSVEAAIAALVVARTTMDDSEYIRDPRVVSLSNGVIKRTPNLQTGINKGKAHYTRLNKLIDSLIEETDSTVSEDSDW